MFPVFRVAEIGLYSVGDWEVLKVSTGGEDVAIILS